MLYLFPCMFYSFSSLAHQVCALNALNEGRKCQMHNCLNSAMFSAMIVLCLVCHSESKLDILTCVYSEIRMNRQSFSQPVTSHRL